MKKLFIKINLKIVFILASFSILLILGHPQQILSYNTGFTYAGTVDPDIVSYKIFRSIQPNVTTTSTLVAVITDLSQASFIDTNLNSNTTYFYKIFVFDRDNLFTSSNEVSAITLPFIRPSPWPMFQHDMRHTGQSEYVGVQTSNLKWMYKTDGSIDSSPSIGSDGTIYVGSTDNNLYAFNPDGTLKWKFKTNNNIVSSPAIGLDGIIYIGSDDTYIYAISSGGTLKWKYATRGNISNSSPAINSDGTIYIGSLDYSLYAFGE
jgi:outer membrane protein assembly factor BamB